MNQDTQTPLTNITPGVDIESAAIETASWRTFMDGLVGAGEQDRIYSYHIPIEDILNIVNAEIPEGKEMTKPTAVRAFFALRPASVGPNGSAAQKRLHLYMVPVDVNGNDVLEIDGVSVIYDTTQPCPNMCGIGNDLNGGATQQG
jgi:hypothetical protein